MIDSLRYLFETSGFPARWHCGNWTPAHGWVHISGDLLIAGAYAAIPTVIAVVAWRRRGEIFFPKLYWLFAAFILSCGLGHFVEATLFWHPWYRFSGAIKLITAVASWATVCALIRYLPAAMTLPGMAGLANALEREIAERRRGEEREMQLNKDLALRVRELETLLEMLPVGIAIALDPACKTIRTNRAFSEIIGIEHGRNASLSVAPPDGPTEFRMHRDGRELEPAELPMQRAAAEGIEIRDFEEQVVRKDGRQADLLCSAAPIFDHERVCRGAIGVFHDITDRKRDEERFRAVVEASPNALLMAGEDGRVTLVNSQAEHLFGCTREELLGAPIDTLVRSDQVAREAGAGADVAKESFARRKDGSELPISIVVSPLRTVEGAFVLACMTDISERKAAEEKVMNSLREKQVLLHEIHHRVKNNLQFIISLLRLQSVETADPRLLDVLEETRSRVHAMALVHEHLYRADDLSRLDYGAYLRELVAAVGRSMSDRMARVSLSVEADAEGLETNAAVPVGFIVNELVSNSLKHAFPDGRTGVVEVRLHGNADTGYDLVIRDNGVGAPSGFNPASMKSMGWRLIAMLIRQLNGTMVLNRDRGTEFAVHFTPRRHL